MGYPLLGPCTGHRDALIDEDILDYSRNTSTLELWSEWRGGFSLPENMIKRLSEKGIWMVSFRHGLLEQQIVSRAPIITIAAAFWKE